jgi:hypothetical protein
MISVIFDIRLYEEQCFSVNIALSVASPSVRSPSKSSKPSSKHAIARTCLSLRSSRRGP